MAQELINSRIFEINYESSKTLSHIPLPVSEHELALLSLSALPSVL